MTEQVIRFMWPYAVGSVVLLWGQLTIYLVLRVLWTKLGAMHRPGAIQSTILGTTEMLLYLGAFIYRKPEFVGLWLGLKTVVKWRHWEYDIAIYFKHLKQPRWILGRNAYNLFLLGNSLVILFSFAASKIVEYLLAGASYKIYAVIASLIAFSIAILVAAICSPRYRPLANWDKRVSKKSAAKT